MIFNCSKYKGKINPNTLYAVYRSDTIQFIEKQNDIDEDLVNVQFNLEKGQYGMFANEYRPGFLANSKKVDILLFVVDEAKKLSASWILDIKVSVGGKEVIAHLIEQWQASHQHKCTLSNYLEGFAETETIGVITRDYQTKRIQAIAEDLEKEIAAAEKELNAIPNSSIKLIQQRRLLNKRKEYQMFDKFKNGYVTIADKDYPIKIYQLEGDTVPYSCNMEARLA